MKLIAVTDDRMNSQQLLDTLLKIETYIDRVILREKSKTDAEVIDLIQQLKAAGFDHTKIIVHARADIATAAGINKVQLPGSGVAIQLAKQHHPTISFGRSVHSFKEAEEACANGASWLLYGHLYGTDSKQGLPPRGTEELYRIADTMPIPVFAIGGIKPQHLQLLHESKIAGAACMSAIFGSEDPLQAVMAYKGESHATTH